MESFELRIDFYCFRCIKNVSGSLSKWLSGRIIKTSLFYLLRSISFSLLFILHCEQMPLLMTKIKIEQQKKCNRTVAILNTTRKFSSAIIQRPSLVNVANDGRDAVAREDPAKLRPDLLFFGEIYRTCFEYIHIVDAAKFVVLFDFLVLILELDFFISKVGYFDVLHCLHLIWAVGSGLSAVIGFWQERFFLFWPLIALKATKFVLCLFTAVLLLILNLTYRRGLHKFIKWNYPRVEDTVTFSYLLFFLCLIFLTLDGLIFDLLYRVQIYFRRKAMAIYFMERQEILSIFV